MLAQVPAPAGERCNWLLYGVVPLMFVASENVPPLPVIVKFVSVPAVRAEVRTENVLVAPVLVSVIVSVAIADPHCRSNVAVSASTTEIFEIDAPVPPETVNKPVGLDQFVPLPVAVSDTVAF